MENIKLAKITSANDERVTLEYDTDDRVVRAGTEILDMHADDLITVDAAYAAICDMYNTSVWDFEDMYA